MVGVATQTINGQRWPDGTAVAVYPAEARVAGSDAVPSGASVAVASVAHGSVTFTGLVTGRRYIAYALGLAIGFLIGPGSVDLLRDITGTEAQTIRDLLTSLGISLDGLEDQVPVPSLTAINTPLLPASGSTVALREATKSNGVDTVSMSRFQVPVTDDVHLFAPVWAGWGLVQTTETADAGVLIIESDTPNAVRVSAAVETVDGRVYRLSAGGSRKWTVSPGGMVACDPLDIDVPVADSYFWLRCRVEVDPGGVWWQNRHVPTTPTGQLVVNYAINPTLDYSTAVLALTPDLYWKLNESNGATDQSTHGRNGTAAGGVNIGGAASIFSDGATTFDGVDDGVKSTYNPFTNGQPISVCGIAYRNAVASDTLFSSDAVIDGPLLRCNQDASPTQVQFWAQTTGVSAIWNDVWPVAQWVHWALVFDEAGNTAELYINGVSVGSRAMAGAFNAAAGNFEVSRDNAAPWGGQQAHVSVFANQALTAPEVAALYAAVLTSGSDQTNATGALPTLGSSSAAAGTAHAPVLLAGKFNPLVRKPIVAIWGDSISDGYGDSPDITDGFASRALRIAQIPSVKLSKGAERGLSQTIGTHIARRLALSDGATHAIYAMGVNDDRSPRILGTPAYMAVNTVINCMRLANRGVEVYATTLTPGALSSDGWATVGNQTPHIQDTQRTRYNDWLRIGAPLAVTSLTSAVALNGATISGLVDTSSFPTAGVAVINGVPVRYTGKTSSTLTGCAALAIPYLVPSAALVPAGTLVYGVVSWIATVVATASLPAATVALAATYTTNGYANAGTLHIGSGLGDQVVTYTGITSSTFTGCTGGVAVTVGGNAALQDLVLPANVLLAGDAGHPLAGYFELADRIESARNSGKWKAPGYTADGIHPSSVGYDAMVLGVDTSVFTVA